MDNNQRVANGYTTVNQEAYEGFLDMAGSLRDVLTDLLHLFGPDEFNRALEMSRIHFEEELLQEEEAD